MVLLRMNSMGSASPFAETTEDKALNPSYQSGASFGSWKLCRSSLLVRFIRFPKESRAARPPQ